MKKPKRNEEREAKAGKNLGRDIANADEERIRKRHGQATLSERERTDLCVHASENRLDEKNNKARD